jgi:hypothetical protein
MGAAATAMLLVLLWLLLLLLLLLRFCFLAFLVFLSLLCFLDLWPEPADRAAAARLAVSIGKAEATIGAADMGCEVSGKLDAMLLRKQKNESANFGWCTALGIRSNHVDITTPIS